MTATQNPNTATGSPGPGKNGAPEPAEAPDRAIVAAWGSEQSEKSREAEPVTLAYGTVLATILRDLFLSRTDILAFLPSWKTPCPTSPISSDELFPLLLAHVMGPHPEVQPASLGSKTKKGAKAECGYFRLGTYTPTVDNLTRTIGIDIDGGPGHSSALVDPDAAATQILQNARGLNIPFYAERSGSATGWHLWGIFEEMAPAADARELALSLMPTNMRCRDGSVAVPGQPPLEVFPKTVRMSKTAKRVGSQLWLPWWFDAAPGGCLLHELLPSGQISPEPWWPESAEAFRRISIQALGQALEFLREVAPAPTKEKAKADKASSPVADSSGGPAPRQPAAQDWTAWRSTALAILDLHRIYDGNLTGSESSAGWLQARDFRSPSGDSRPSAGVADGTGDAPRGTFHSFRDGLTLSIFDWIVEAGKAPDFIGAARMVSEASGVPLPAPTWVQEAERIAAEGASEAVPGQHDDGTGPASENETASPGAAALPEINSGDGNFARLEDAAWGAVRMANALAPRYFRYASMAVDIGHDEQKIPQIWPLDGVRMRSALARVARWFKFVGQGEAKHRADAHPPTDVSIALARNPAPPLPILQRITSAPFFAPNGSLCLEPGYHEAAQSYYAGSRALVASLDPVPEAPTAADVARALSWIDELLFDFPFTPTPGKSDARESASRANAVALFLLPFARDLIAGQTPLHVFEAPEKGTGKGMLAKVLLHPALGRAPQSSQGVAGDSEEWKKQLAALLMPAPAVIFLDNLEGELSAGPLASALTEEVWSTRLMRENRDGIFRIRCIWVASANNLRVGGDMDRRIVPIRLDAHCARPWERSGFRHKLPDWGRENRAELVWSALTLIRSWIAAGSPPGPRTLGSYEDYSKVMGGILGNAGIPGFLENMSEMQAGVSPKVQSWLAFLAAWWLNFREPWDGATAACPEPDATKPVGAKDLFSIADKAQLALGEGSERSQSIRLGNQLAASRDRVFSIDVSPDGAREPDLRTVRLELSGSAKRAAQYRLALVENMSQNSQPSDRVPGQEG